MADFSNIPTGLKITSQIPLDIKGYALNEATLAYLGVDDNLAFTYHEGLRVICIEEKTLYEWREVNEGEENTGLIPVDFTYPSDLPEIYGIDYSNRTFNFFEIIGVSGPAGPTGPTGPTGPQGEDGITLLTNGTSTNVSGNGTPSTPYSVETINLQKIVNTFPYTLTSDDDKYTLFVENSTDNVIINVPGDLVENFSCILVQEGLGLITILGTSGAIINYPTLLSNRIKGDKYWAVIEKKLNTVNYFLMGSLQS